MRSFYFLLFWIITKTLSGQSGVIEGRVVDQSGQPLYLALVFNSEVSVGAYTDETGFFQLTTDQSIPELEVFGLGFLNGFPDYFSGLL